MPQVLEEKRNLFYARFARLSRSSPSILAAKPALRTGLPATVSEHAVWEEIATGRFVEDTLGWEPPAGVTQANLFPDQFPH